MERNKISLRTEVLIGTIGSMLLATLFLGVTSVFLARRIIRQSTVSLVERTMQTLGGQVENIFIPYETRVSDIAMAASSSADPVVLDALIHKATDMMGGGNNDICRKCRARVATCGA